MKAGQAPITPANPKAAMDSKVTAPAAAMSPAGTKAAVYTQSDLLAHNNSKYLYLLISGKVYDATPFLPEHPGGFQILVDQAGKDATEAFEDVGHSYEASETLKGLLLGDFMA